MKSILHILIFSFFLLAGGFGYDLNAQAFTLSGSIRFQYESTPCVPVVVLLEPGYRSIHPDKNGWYEFRNLKPGAYTIQVIPEGCEKQSKTIQLEGDSLTVDFLILPMVVDLKMVTIQDTGNEFGMDRLKSVEGTSIYASKKNEVISIDKLTVNLAANNSRQIYARVPGLNIWESDGGGIQLGVGSRGLSPNRTSSFNTRQNGYDISADAMGYPESYYTPPAEAIKKIEVVRGAASLQYGTQFGGMMNFQFRSGPQDKKIELTTRQSGGSWGFFNSFNSVGGTVGKLNYYSYYQNKKSDGWRDNSNFALHNAYTSLRYKISSRLSAGIDYTFFHYLARQAGGLTDAMFANDPRQSFRDRNWFRVNWNLGAFLLDYELSSSTKINSRFFGLLASRESLGYLGLISRADPMGNRDLITGRFSNFGNETRIIQKFSLFRNPSAILAGVRYYQGNTRNAQGDANAGSGPDFSYLNPSNLEKSDFTFPSRNIAFFSESVLNLSKRWSISPGIRFEYIRTASAGFYKEKAYDLAGNLIFEQTVHDSKVNQRAFVLGGLGVSFRPSARSELYGNFSQNFRAINFSDLRVVNPNLKVDQNLKDEKGFNSDLGFRGTHKEWLSYDVSLFYLLYRDRIGVLLKSDSTGTYRYRTNVADSRNAGIEFYTEAELISMILGRKAATRLALFANVAFISAKYFKSAESSISGKRVELVPTWNVKTGLNYRWKKFGASWQISCLSKQYTDATNAEFTANAVNGIIPAYVVSDFSADYSWRFLKFEASVNNLFNNSYFSRRADGYPGPGIMPADGRGYFFTVQVKL